MKVTTFDEDGILTKIHEQTLSFYPMNPKGQLVLQTIDLTEDEWEEAKLELRQFAEAAGRVPPWAPFITVDGKLPVNVQPQIQTVPAGVRVQP